MPRILIADDNPSNAELLDAHLDGSGFDTKLVYNGEDAIYCSGVDQYDGAFHIHIPCTVTGGASGGPWLISPNASWGGYVNGVHSHKSWGANYEGSPYFDGPEQTLFNTYKAA